VVNAVVVVEVVVQLVVDNLESILNFFKKQSFVIVSTLDKNKRIHSVAKGIAKIEDKKIYIMDLYRANTYNNLKRNPIISITAVDEEAFIGYTLKGKGRIIEKEKIKKEFLEEWEKRVIHRVSNRLIKNLKKDTFRHHPEIKLPYPEYMIEFKIEKVIDLKPKYLS